MSAVEQRRVAALRAVLAFLAVSAAYPGLWATLAPGSFYGSFPLGGRGWVAPLGPASGHFLADIGAFYLAFAGLFAWAAWRPQRALVAPLSAAWAAFSVVHLGWHAAHLAPLSAADAVAQTGSLLVVLVAPLLALRLSGPRAVAPTGAQPPAASHLA